jgi:hypothetical protein
VFVGQSMAAVRTLIPADQRRALHILKTGRIAKEWVAFPNGFPDSGVMELLQLTAGQLRQAASLKERIQDLERQLESILGLSATTATQSRKLHWTQTPAGRARLARSVRNSWRSGRRSSKPSGTRASGGGKKLHWTQTPAGRIKMDKIRRKRWENR